MIAALTICGPCRWEKQRQPPFVVWESPNGFPIMPRGFKLFPHWLNTRMAPTVVAYAKYQWSTSGHESNFVLTPVSRSVFNLLSSAVSLILAQKWDKWCAEMKLTKDLADSRVLDFFDVLDWGSGRIPPWIDQIWSVPWLRMADPAYLL